MPLLSFANFKVKLRVQKISNTPVSVIVILNS